MVRLLGTCFGTGLEANCSDESVRCTVCWERDVEIGEVFVLLFSLLLNGHVAANGLMAKWYSMEMIDSEPDESNASVRTLTLLTKGVYIRLRRTEWPLDNAAEWHSLDDH